MIITIHHCSSYQHAIDILELFKPDMEDEISEAEKNGPVSAIIEIGQIKTGVVVVEL